MAIPYSQDWAAGDSVFSSLDIYDRSTDGPDALYPEINYSEGVDVVGGALDWRTTYGDYQGMALWLRGMGSLTGGGGGAYAASGFWDASVGFVRCTYTPNATSLGVVTYVPLIWLLSPSESSLLAVYWNQTSGQYEVERNTEDGYALTPFAGEAPAAGVPLEVSLDWKCGTYPGVVPTEHDADGYLRVYLNGVLAYEETAIALYLTFSSTPVNLIDGVAFGFYGFLGALDGITISDAEDVEDDTSIPTSDSTTCCRKRKRTNDPPGPRSGLPAPPLQPWAAQCAGGGAVPFAGDVVDGEGWAL